MTNLLTDTYLFNIDLLKATLGFIYLILTYELLFLYRILA